MHSLIHLAVFWLPHWESPFLPICNIIVKRLFGTPLQFLGQNDGGIIWPHIRFLRTNIKVAIPMTAANKTIIAMAMSIPLLSPVNTGSWKLWAAAGITNPTAKITAAAIFTKYLFRLFHIISVHPFCKPWGHPILPKRPALPFFSSFIKSQCVPGFHIKKHILQYNEISFSKIFIVYKNKSLCHRSYWHRPDKDTWLNFSMFLGSIPRWQPERGWAGGYAVPPDVRCMFPPPFINSIGHTASSFQRSIVPPLSSPSAKISFSQQVQFIKLVILMEGPGSMKETAFFIWLPSNDNYFLASAALLMQVMAFRLRG